MNDSERFASYLNARQACILIQTFEELYASEIVLNVAHEKMIPTLAWSASRGVYHPFNPDTKPVAETEHPAAGLFYLLNMSDPPQMVVLHDILDYLPDPKLHRLIRDLYAAFNQTHGTMVFIDHNEAVPETLANVATRFELTLPTEEELEKLVRSWVTREHRERGVKAKVTRSAFDLIIRNLRGLTRSQAERVIMEAIADDNDFADHDVNTIIASKRRMLHQDSLLEYIESPVSLDSIAGVKTLKRWLAMRQKAFNDDAKKFGIDPPRGVLMLGVPGAGKSLCAKAVATASQFPLLRLDPSALYDRYIGESERRLRQALKQAEAMSPIILWIDEIEKGFASAGLQSNDGGLSQRMFGTLLTWMQEHTEPVFLIATANNIEALPPELLRKGRFDEIFFVDLPKAAVRKAIFKIHLNKRHCDPKQFDLEKLAENSDGFTGSEIEQAIISALHEAYAQSRSLNTGDVVTALNQTSPLSVIMGDRLDALRQWAQSRCVMAD
ncbi:MAG: ATPase [Phycisphaeraceae bacterium]|nr:ATPase [Phycisphaeraceae bacterium]